MTGVFLLWHISHALRANVSSTSTMTEALCATSKLVMMRNFWASTPATPLPRPESSLPGRRPDSATNLIASKTPCTHSTRTNGPKASLLPNEAARRRAIRDSDQRSALPYLPLPMARTGVPADEPDRATDLPTGTRRQGVVCGSAPTLYSSQVQQPARIPAHYGEPLRTIKRLLTWPYAGARVNLPVSGGQGVAGSNPAVPTGHRYFSPKISGANWGANGFPGLWPSRPWREMAVGHQDSAGAGLHDALAGMRRLPMKIREEDAALLIQGLPFQIALSRSSVTPKCRSICAWAAAVTRAAETGHRGRNPIWRAEDGSFREW